MLNGIYDLDDEPNAPLYSRDDLCGMSDLTPEERGIGVVVRLLRDITSWAITGKFESNDVDPFASIEEWLDLMQNRILSIDKESEDSMLLPISSELIVPYWNYFHWVYTTFDGLQLILVTFEEVKDLYKPTDRLMNTTFLETKSRFDEKNRNLMDNLQRTAVKLRIPLNQRQAVKELIKASVGWDEDSEDPVGHELRHAIDRDLIENFATRMLSSWRIGLDSMRTLVEE